MCLCVLCVLVFVPKTIVSLRSVCFELGLVQVGPFVVMGGAVQVFKLFKHVRVWLPRGGPLAFQAQLDGDGLGVAFLGAFPARWWAANESWYCRSASS